MNSGAAALPLRHLALALFTVASLSLLASCSGGGSGTSGTATPAASAAPPAGAAVVTVAAASNGPRCAGNTIDTCISPSGGGHWFGNLSAAGATVGDVFCLVTEAGQLSCVISDPAGWPGTGPGPFDAGRRLGSIKGEVALVGAGQFAGTGRVYAAPGRVLWDGSSTVADFTVSAGRLIDQRVLSLPLEGMGTVTTLRAEFDHYYIHADAMSEVAGVYASTELWGVPTSLVVEQDGAVRLQTAAGCVGDGRLSVIEPQYNSYALQVTLANCASLNGRYDGLATVTDFQWVNGSTDVLITAFNHGASIVGLARK